MGALHQGHLSLVEISKEQCDITVVSIFVNPKQFNDAEDLKKYPRTIESDAKKLHERATDVLFCPDVEEVYPAGLDTSIEFDPGPAAKIMEGRFRPGHFQGMAEVVYRLLSIVGPDKLFMGQKDYQQLAIVRKMITDMHMPILLEMGPTIREPNGLAMSSRNERLSLKSRDEASLIYKTLTDAQRWFEEGEPVDKIKAKAMTMLTQNQFEPEYFEIVDGITFEPIGQQGDSQFVVACCAVKVEGVRLIDNAIWTRSE
jgi:pantoate--beta-alanine ligase